MDTRTLLAAVAALVGTAALAPVALAGQHAEHAPEGRTTETADPAERLEALAQRVSALTAHFVQMRRSVEQNPELQEQAGWAGARTLHWSAGLGGLVGALSRQAAALANHLSEARSDPELSGRAGMAERLEGLQARLRELTGALEGMRTDLDAMQGVVHGDDHAH